jgi:hypothetical protein
LTSPRQAETEQENTKEEKSSEQDERLNEKREETLPSAPTSKNVEKDDFEALAKRFADLKRR